MARESGQEEENCIVLCGGFSSFFMTLANVRPFERDQWRIGYTQWRDHPFGHLSNFATPSALANRPDAWRSSVCLCAPVDDAHYEPD